MTSFELIGFFDGAGRRLEISPQRFCIEGLGYGGMKVSDCEKPQSGLTLLGAQKIYLVGVEYEEEKYMHFESGKAFPSKITCVVLYAFTSFPTFVHNPGPEDMPKMVKRAVEKYLPSWLATVGVDLFFKPKEILARSEIRWVWG